MNIGRLKNNDMSGYGLFSSLRKDKKDSEKSYLELDQFGGKLTIICEDSSLYSKLAALQSTKELTDETIIHYQAKVSVLNEARHGTSKAGNDYSFVGSRLSMPMLRDFEIVEEA